MGLLHRVAGQRRRSSTCIRTRLDGKGKQERVTPQDQPGYHVYKISPDGRWAFHV